MHDPRGRSPQGAELVAPPAGPFTRVAHVAAEPADSLDATGASGWHSSRSQPGVDPSRQNGMTSVVLPAVDRLPASSIATTVMTFSPSTPYPVLCVVPI